MVELTPTIIDSEHYVARYTRGDLTDVEREAFEDYCVANPEYAEQVAADRALRFGFSRLERRSQSSSFMRYAMAAGVAALALAAGILLWRNGASEHTVALKPGVLASNYPAGLERVRLTSLRGAAQTVIILDDAVHAFRVDFDPGLAEASQATFKLFEHTPHGDVERGATTQPIEGRPGERRATVVIEIGGASRPNLRLDVSLAGVTNSFELRVERR